MKRLFLITSCAVVEPADPFKGTPVRSFFNDEQRIDQTLETVYNCKMIDPVAEILLADISRNKILPFEFLKTKTVHYCHLESIDSESAHIARTHTNKSHCEARMLLSVFQHFKDWLSNFDIITKVSGRYQLEQKLYNPDDLDSINHLYFTKKMAWPVAECLHMKHLSPFKIEDEDGTVCSLRTTAYAVGKNKFLVWEYLMGLLCEFTKSRTSSMYCLDVEYILYHFLKTFNLLQEVKTVPWRVMGTCGITGRWVHY